MITILICLGLSSGFAAEKKIPAYYETKIVCEPKDKKLKELGFFADCEHKIVKYPVYLDDVLNGILKAVVPKKRRRR